MSLNRREFVKAGAAAIVGGRVLGNAALAAQAGQPRLYLDAKAVAILVIGRSKAATGMPATTTRADLLFLRHPEHAPPQLLIEGSTALSLDGADLRIKADGVELTAGTMSLDTTAPKVLGCPTSDEWLSLSCVPEFEEILAKPVAIKPVCVRDKAPGLIAGRMTMRQGKLMGGLPQYNYAGEQFFFPEGNPLYVRSFTDVVNWEVALPAGAKQLTFEAINLADGKLKDSRTVSIKNDVLGHIETERVADAGAPPTDQIVHFRHYYDYLDYQGPSAPIPVRLKTTGCKTFTATSFQLQQLKRIETLKEQFKVNQQKQKQEDREQFFGGPSAEADDARENTSTMRSESAFCACGIVYHDFV